MSLIIEAEDIMSKKDWRDTYSAQQKYDSLNTKRFAFKLNLKTDADVIEALETADSKQGLIKDAIRFYIANKK